MMLKGWRLNPGWVLYVKAREEERAISRMHLRQLEATQAMLQFDRISYAAMARIAESRFGVATH